MNRTTLVLPLTALLLAACGGSSTTTTPSASTLTTVNGTVQGFSGGTSSVKLLANDSTQPESASNPALASAAVSTTGTFALTLPSQATLTPYLSATSSSNDGVSSDGTCSGSVSNSDPTSQAYSFSTLSLNGNVLSTATVTSSTSTSASLTANFWIYVTKATTLSGKVSCSATSSGTTDNASFTVNTPFAQGWNVVNLSETLTVSDDRSVRTTAISAVTGSAGPSTWTAVSATTQGVKAQLLRTPALNPSTLLQRAFSGHLKF